MLTIKAEIKRQEQKDKEIDFIQFSRQWIAKATIKGASNYKTVINSLDSETWFVAIFAFLQMGILAT